jgi:hypothetical protein
MAETVKKRNWTFVLYPESAPKDWLEILKLSGLMSAISPLHDKDLNPTGEPKKAHYHILLVYSGPTTYNAVAKFTASLNATIPQPLESVRGMYRYFSHKDNPEKYQYSEAEIVTVNGFNIADLVELTRSEVNELKMQILAIVRDVGITEYASLIDFLVDNGMSAEYDVAVNNTLFFNTYITSRRHGDFERAQSYGRLALLREKELQKATKTENCTKEAKSHLLSDEK